MLITSDQVARHEHHGEFIIVFVVTPPDGIVVLVELFPEIGDGLVFIVVGIEPFEVVHVEVTLGKGTHGILGLLGSRSQSGFLGSFFLLLVVLLLILLVGLFGGLALALAALGLGDLVTEGNIAQNGLGLRLIDNSAEPTSHIGIRFTVKGKY